MKVSCENLTDASGVVYLVKESLPAIVIVPAREQDPAGFKATVAELKSPHVPVAQADIPPCPVHVRFGGETDAGQRPIGNSDL
jgi:hypothetical protein